jgi:hypothetical protein
MAGRPSHSWPPPPRPRSRRRARSRCPPRSAPTCAARPAATKAQQLAADPGVKALAEPDTTNRHNRSVDNINARPTGTSADYLVRRLKRDRPDIAEALARGEYPIDRASIPYCRAWPSRRPNQSSRSGGRAGRQNTSRTNLCAAIARGRTHMTSTGGAPWDGLMRCVCVDVAKICPRGGADKSRPAPGEAPIREPLSPLSVSPTLPKIPMVPTPFATRLPDKRRGRLR